MPCNDEEYPIFTEEMKKEHTILIPTMLPVHFSLISRILNNYGYKTELLTNMGEDIKEYGLKYVHNDTCYPAQLVIGQMLSAIESGKYDTHKLSLLISQTGGGCRASNYISLLRKALKKAGYGYIPVISFNLVGLEKGSAFKLTFPMLHRMLYCVMYGDLMMCLQNQCRPYELNPGDTDRVTRKWTDKLAEEMSSNALSYRKVKKNYDRIIADYAAIPCDRSVQKPRVGIVGEIFVKFSPLGNNDLENFLINDGAEPVMPGLADFCLYSLYNSIADSQLYRRGVLKAKGAALAYRFLIGRQRRVIQAIEDSGTGFRPMSCFEDTRRLIKGFIGIGAKMGEGWLLTAEMLELIHAGVKSIVCTQPFGCLPNHIVGKGKMKPLKEAFPDVNIVAIDYDAGATRINQENRIKLMLANAKAPAGSEI